MRSICQVPEDAKITEITFKFDSQKDQTADLPIPTGSGLEDLPENAVIPKGWNGVAVIQNNQVSTELWKCSVQ